MRDQIDFNDHQNQFDDANTSNNPEFADIIQTRINRRTVLKGSAGVTAAAFLGMSMTGCGGSGSGGEGGSEAAERPSELKFKAVPHDTSDKVTVPEGYKAEVILPMGTPLVSQIADWNDNGLQSGDSFSLRMGDNHDGMWFFGKNGNKFDPNASDSGLICINHEYTKRSVLNPKGDYTTTAEADKGTIYEKRRLADDVRRGVNAHGVAVAEIKRKSDGNGFELVQNSGFNRRLTSISEAMITGPAAGSDYLKTKYDPTGTKTRGINNQCGAGNSPWGTYITVEENFRGVFARGQDTDKLSTNEKNARTRYDFDEGFATWGYRWHSPNDAAEAVEGEFARWDATATGETATDDYRNAFNTFGYIVEIDPFDPTSKPQKRTALGRFAHENCSFAPVEEGKPVVFYMGDDSRGEYIYKFVSKATWSNSDIGGGLKAGDKYMNEGALYVAVFNADGTGEWKELALGKNGITSSNSDFSFTDAAEVNIFTRFAADAAGATKMDRPEWVTVNPDTKEVYITLTNNAKGTRVWNDSLDGRVAIDPDAANPRAYGDKGNINGHIIRWKEKGNDHAATSFKWDIYLMASPYDLEAENLSKLNKNNDLSSPDGLMFDPRGVLWIQTDDGAYTDTSNCMLLAALPGKVSDGGEVTTSAGQKTFIGAAATDATVKRFLTGPYQCEVTGMAFTPDLKTMFVNIQHPGDKTKRGGEVTGHWPASQTDSSSKALPRSATVVITREDGGVILGESL